MKRLWHCTEGHLAERPCGEAMQIVMPALALLRHQIPRELPARQLNHSTRPDILIGPDHTLDERSWKRERMWLANLPHGKCLSPRPCWKRDECRKTVPQPGHGLTQGQVGSGGAKLPQPAAPEISPGMGQPSGAQVQAGLEQCTGRLWWAVPISQRTRG